MSDRERDELTRLHNEENYAGFAIRKEEREMAAQERELEREMETFEQDEAATKRKLRDELRKEHFGHEPERRPPWPDEE